MSHEIVTPELTQAIERLAGELVYEIASNHDCYSVDSYRALLTVTRWLSTQPAAVATIYDMDWKDHAASLEEGQAEWERAHRALDNMACDGSLCRESHEGRLSRGTEVKARPV